MLIAPSKATLAMLAALTIAGAPALAKSTPAQGSALKLTVKEKNGQTLYCMKEEAITGSILPKNRCLTREDWAEKGVSIPAPDSRVEAAKNQPGS